MGQLIEIIKVIGTPTPQDLKAMNPNYPMYEFSPKEPPLPWVKVLRDYSTKDGVDLVSQLVKYDPAARLPPLQVLLHPYFDDLRAQEKPQHLALFNFLPDELIWCTRQEYEKL